MPNYFGELITTRANLWFPSNNNHDINLPQSTSTLSRNQRINTTANLPAPRHPTVTPEILTHQKAATAKPRFQWAEPSAFNCGAFPQQEDSFCFGLAAPTGRPLVSEPDRRLRLVPPTYRLCYRLISAGSSVRFQVGWLGFVEVLQPFEFSIADPFYEENVKQWRKGFHGLELWKKYQSV